MNIFRNSKGFTLVELLATMVIIGIVGGLSIPLIRNSIEAQTERKYKTYGESLISSAKLYNDSYGDDLWLRGQENGCVLITLKELKSKRLAKDIDLSDIACDDEKSKVRIKKTDNKFKYDYSIFCGVADDDGNIKSDGFQFPSDDLSCD